jgi:ketosteroid isomerase-like protein
MSQENVEVVKDVMSRFEAGDRQAWREHFDPNVVWDTSASQLPAASVYHGHRESSGSFVTGFRRGRTTRLRPASTSMRGMRWLSCFGRAGRAGVAG